MIKKILTITMLSTLLLTSCKETSKQENTKSNTVENFSETIVKKTSVDKYGKKLEIAFNNLRGIATLSFNGEKDIILTQKKAASGIWFINDIYELRGKGNNLQLKKQGELVFEHEDDIVQVEQKNNKGDVLNLTFNNTEGTVKVYFNGGKQINLVAEKAASGIWYKNNEYELRGKGDTIVLTKNGKPVFKK